VQSDLANVVLDGRRTLPVRRDAAHELVRHIEQHTPALPGAELAALQTFYGRKDTDPALKGDLALILGSLHPDARATGERLLRYQPPEPTPAPAPKSK
jgi:hypothetical protein